MLNSRHKDARTWAWEFAIQRLERFGTDEEENVHVLPDEGHGYFIRSKLRAMWRHSAPPSAFGSGILDRKAANIVEDSSDRRSHESYFVQLADLNAYAAFRHVHPRPHFDGTVWDELGDSRHTQVNDVRGGPPAIVSWP